MLSTNRYVERNVPFLLKMTNPLFPLFSSFRFRVLFAFYFFISLHDKPVVDSIHAYSGLFNRQGLDTVYEVYFVLLLCSPLLTARLFIVTLRTNRKALTRPIIWQYFIFVAGIMMFMVRKRKHTLSQTPLDGRQVSEISCTVNKYDYTSC